MRAAVEAGAELRGGLPIHFGSETPYSRTAAISYCVVECQGIAMPVLRCRRLCDRGHGRCAVEVGHRAIGAAVVSCVVSRISVRFVPSVRTGQIEHCRGTGHWSKRRRRPCLGKVPIPDILYARVLIARCSCKGCCGGNE